MTPLRATAFGSSILALLLAAAACGPESDTPLGTAAARGDVARVKTLLAQGADPNEIDGAGLAPLHRAVRNPDLAVVQSLLEGGAEVDLRDRRNHWTPLQHAVHTNQSAVSLTLLEAGADPGGALVMAAGYGNTTIVRALLEAGVAPGVDALWAAAGGGAINDITDGPPLGSCFPETVEALLEKAPDLRLGRDLETRALSWLARSESCKALLRKLERG